MTSLLVPTVLCALAVLGARGADPVRVVARKTAPFLFDDPASGGKLSGYCVDLLDLLAKEAGFTYTFGWASGADDIVSTLSSNATDYTLGIGNVLVTDVRLLSVDFTQPFLESSLSTIVSVPKSSVDMWSFFSPFTLGMWLTIAGVMLGSGVVFYAVEGRSRKQEDIRGLFPSLYWGFSCILGYNGSFPKTAAGMTVYLVLFFFNIVVVSSYTANLAATLSVKYAAPKIEGFASLPGHTVCSGSGGTTELYLREKLETTANLVFEPNITRCLEMLRNEEVDAVVYSQPIMEYYLSNKPFCDLIEVGQPVFPNNYAMPVRKGQYELLSAINVALLKVQKQGTLVDLYETWFRKSTCEVDIESRKSSLSESIGPESILGLIVIVGVGCFLALAYHAVFGVLLAGRKRKGRVMDVVAKELMGEEEEEEETASEGEGATDRAALEKALKDIRSQLNRIEGLMTAQPSALVLGVHGGDSIRVMARKTAPFLFNDPVTQQVTGYCVDLLDLLAQDAGFTYTFGWAKGADDIIKALSTNATNATDYVLGTGNVLVTDERLLSVDFTQPFLESSLSTVVTVPKSSVDMWSFFSPFTLGMWLTIAGVMLGSGVVFYAVEGRYDKQENVRGLLPSLYWGFSCILNFNGAFPKTASGMSVYVVLFFFNIVVVSSYTANLAATLSVKYAAPKIEGFGSLPGHTVCSGSGGSTEEYLREKLGTSATLVFDSNITKCLEMLRNGDVDAVVYSKPTMEYFLSNQPFCDLIQVGQPVFPNNYAMPVRKGQYHLLSSINIALLKIQKEGSLLKLYETWFRKSTCKVDIESRKSSRSSAIGPESILGLIVIVGIGCAIALAYHAVFGVLLAGRKAKGKVVDVMFKELMGNKPSDQEMSHMEKMIAALSSQSGRPQPLTAAPDAVLFLNRVADVVLSAPPSFISLEPAPRDARTSGSSGPRERTPDPEEAFQSASLEEQEALVKQIEPNPAARRTRPPPSSNCSTTSSLVIPQARRALPKPSVLGSRHKRPRDDGPLGPDGGPAEPLAKQRRSGRQPAIAPSNIGLSQTAQMLGSTTCLIGMPGVGKTASVVQLAADDAVWVVYMLCCGTKDEPSDSDMRICGFSDAAFRTALRDMEPWPSPETVAASKAVQVDGVSEYRQMMYCSFLMHAEAELNTRCRVRFLVELVSRGLFLLKMLEYTRGVLTPADFIRVQARAPEGSAYGAQRRLARILVKADLSEDSLRALIKWINQRLVNQTGKRLACAVDDIQILGRIRANQFISHNAPQEATELLNPDLSVKCLEAMDGLTNRADDADLPKELRFLFVVDIFKRPSI
eukprot:m51a1_g8303 putative glutamate receptor -like (1316) ;mRNA; r:47281-56998